MATDYLTQVTDELNKRGVSADVAASILNAANGAKNYPVTLPANPADAITDKSASSSTTNDAAPVAGDWYTKTRQQLGLDTESAQAAIAGEDRTEFIKDYYAKVLEAELAGMDTAYKNADAELDQAKNRAAAQDAVARQAFDERAAATGLNTGTAGQAELTRSSVLQGELAQIDRDKSSLLAEYESAFAKAKAENDVAMTEALYEELMRLKGLVGKTTTTGSTSGSSYSGGSYGGGGGNTSTPATTTATVQPNGRFVPVGADGKAPAGCKVGDLVVTGGGTYLITAVNPDGSYESYPYLPGTTTGNFTGTYIDGTVGAGAIQPAPAAPVQPVTPVTPAPISGNYYKVNPNGKAPAGLSVGDKVVTAGGVFEITAVKPDGSYESTLVDKGTTIANYHGSAPSSVYGNDYEAILSQAQQMQRQGVTKENIAYYLGEKSTSDLTDMGIDAILKSLGYI